MTEETVVVPTTEDRTMPAISYALYLVGLTTGITILIGLIIAYVSRDRATPKMASHYTFLIRTFWLSIVLFLIGGALCVVGGIFSIVLVGIPFLMLGIAICSLVWIWFAVRAVVGVIYLARDEAYPRPDTWMV